MDAATDVQRYLKPSVALHRQLVDSGWDVNSVGPDQQNVLEHGARVTDKTPEFAAGGGNIAMFREVLAAYGKPKGNVAARLLVRAAEQESSAEILRFLRSKKEKGRQKNTRKTKNWT